MKRKIFFGITLVLSLFIFTSCEGLNRCKICRQVTYVDGLITHEGVETEYCDADLIAIESTSDYVNGNTRITWVCR